MPGPVKDAQWFAAGANRTHGLPRTNADKANAVKRALLHPNGVGHTVLKYRQEMEAAAQIAQSTERTGRDGRTTNTSKIGNSPPVAKPKSEEPEVADDIGSEPDEPDPAQYHQRLDDEGDAPGDETGEEITTTSEASKFRAASPKRRVFHDCEYAPPQLRLAHLRGKKSSAVHRRSSVYKSSEKWTAKCQSKCVPSELQAEVTWE